MDNDIRYARNGGVAIAYRVVGEAETDLVYVAGYMSNLVYEWEHPRMRQAYERLGRSFRLILFDKRGTGLSDHGSMFASLETRMEDLRAVLDAAGSSRPVVYGSFEGAGMAILFAATYPERVKALTLLQPVAGSEQMTEEKERELAALRARWGTQEFADELLQAGAPSLYANEDDRRWYANWLRVGASPAIAYAMNRAYFETDLTAVLPAVRVPTLVLYREELPEQALAVTAQIPGARAVQLPSGDLFEDFPTSELVEELERFASGEVTPEIPDSVLATVFFTDIVGSTARAAALGDRAWRDLLAQHHARVRRELARFRGVERDTAGDGFFATFDGPVRSILCGHAVLATLGELGLQARVGVHVGECELHEDKVTGLAVSIGARLAEAAQPGEVLVSSTVRDLVAGSGIAFEDRGKRELKGVPGVWKLDAALPA